MAATAAVRSTISFSENCFAHLGIDVVGHVRLRNQCHRFGPGERGAFTRREDRRLAPSVEQVHALVAFAELARVARMHGEAIGAAVDLAQLGVELGLIDISLQRGHRLVGRRIDLGHVDALLHEPAPLLGFAAPATKLRWKRVRGSGAALTFA